MAASTGCFQPEPITREQLQRGYVVMLPGVESGAWQFQGTIQGLREGGVARAIEVIEWGVRPFGSLPNLTDLPANRRRARDIAVQIGQYHAKYPDRPITLIGYSGGGGLAVMVAEALYEPVMLDRLILLAPALSPHYDLSKALAKCSHGCVNFYSKGDFWTLGVGTSSFGTIDRKYTKSAGHVTFQVPQSTSTDQSALKQIAWTKDWIKLGHGGGHTGWLAKDWARKILAPTINEFSASNRN
ncbi:MAG: serine aminopeptidase domain-containing protein [Planctomycetota bacterium]